MKDKIVVGPDLTPDRLKKFEGVLGEITRQLVQGLHSPGKGLSLEQGQIFTEHRNAFPDKILAAVSTGSSNNNGGISPYIAAPLLNTEAFIADWQEFCRLHGMKMNNPSFKLPLVTPGFNWGVWVPKGMTPQRAYGIAASMFPCWKWCGERSLDEVIDFSRETRSASAWQYVVWCRDRVEADEELKNISALQIAERQINTLGLTETLLLHGWFYWKSGDKHLDVKNISLCPASRYSGGDVPGVYWDGYSGKLHVDRYNPGGADGILRFRQAVS